MQIFLTFFFFYVRAAALYFYCYKDVMNFNTSLSSIVNMSPLS